MLEPSKNNTEAETLVDLVVAKETELKSVYSSSLSSYLLTGITLLAGVLYIVIQWYKFGAIEDSMFVSLLIGATMILASGIGRLDSYIQDKGFDFYAFVVPQEDPTQGLREYEKLRTGVFNSKWMTLSGMIYGASVGCAPFVLNVWSNDLSLRCFLALFMFTVNYVTGIAFYGLVVFFVRSLSMGRIVRVELWQRENPSTAFLLGASRKIALLASIYISACLSSVLFSVLPIGNLVIAYSAFSGLIILSSLLIPTFRIAEKLNTAKRKALLEVSKHLQTEFQNRLDSVGASQTSEEFKRLESLLFLREKIETVQIWPFKLKFVGSVVSVIVVSSIPVILQFVLEHGLSNR